MTETQRLALNKLMHSSIDGGQKFGEGYLHPIGPSKLEGANPAEASINARTAYALERQGLVKIVNEDGMGAIVKLTDKGREVATGVNNYS